MDGGIGAEGTIINKKNSVLKKILLSPQILLKKTKNFPSLFKFQFSNFRKKREL